MRCGWGKSYTGAMGGTHTAWRLAGLALAWLGGVALHLQERTLWPPAAYIALAAIAASMLASGWRWRRVVSVAIVGAALAGFALSGWRASLQMSEELASALEGRDMVVVG